ncbi:hypothetical protein G9A89_014553 [Geosiphon pyriformis]|nr:hypothetical protein G9A89_014553 [Geosiphon pyriformis]
MIEKSTSKSRSPIPKPESISKSRAKSKHLPANDAAANLSSTSISDPSLSTTATSNISTTTIHNISNPATSNLSTSNHSNTTPKLTSIQNPKTENDTTKLEIGNEDTTPSNLETNPIQKLTSNILPATVTENETLAAIFPFEFEETTPVSLFSKAAFEEKPITAMDVKPSNAQSLIEFKKETRKPTWEAYQVLWADQDHNKLPPVPSWNSNVKGKQKETELTWISDQAWETKNDYNKPANWE